MKTIIFIIFLAFTVSLNAQNEVKSLTPTEKTNNELIMAKEKLQLTPDQAVRYKKILEKYNKLESEILKLSKNSATKRVEKRFELIKKRNEEVKSLLTGEQYATYSSWMGLDQFEVMEKNRPRVDSLEKK